MHGINFHPFHVLNRMVTDIPASTDNTHGEYTRIPISDQAMRVYFLSFYCMCS
jgi:hypothetical protein